MAWGLMVGLNGEHAVGAPQNHWFGPAGDPRGAGIGTPEVGKQHLVEHARKVLVPGHSGQCHCCLNL